MAYNPLDTLSKNIATAGSFLHAPELGLSEYLSGVQASPISYSTTPYYNFNQSSKAATGDVLGSQAPQIPSLTGGNSNPSTGFGTLNNTNPYLGLASTGGRGGSNPPNNSAELSALNNQFDYYKSQGENQLNSLTGDYNTGVAQANTNYQGIVGQVNQQKTAAGQARDKNIEQAGAAAQSAQRSNRNTLRALGILNSSAAGELLSKPINEFGKIRADYVQAFQDRSNQLDDFLNQKTSEHVNLLNQLKNQYETLKGNIQNDLRFSDRQRVDAINAANAALSARIGEIKQAQNTIKDKVNAQKLQLLQEAGQLQAYQNPEFNYMDFTKNVLIPQLQQQSLQSVGLAGSDYQKRLTQQ